MGDLKAPTMVIMPDLTLWKAFDYGLHSDLENAVKLITEWYNERLKDGYGLVLAGNCGCGKTHLAKAVKDIHVMRCKYWSEIDLIKAIQDSFDSKTATSNSAPHKAARTNVFHLLSNIPARFLISSSWKLSISP